MDEINEFLEPVGVIGASGRSGQAVARALEGQGIRHVAIVRNAARWQATGLPASARQADLEGEQDRLSAAMEGVGSVVSCAHARHVPAILRAAGPGVARFVFLGSTRKFTRWPDAHGNGVLEGEAAFHTSQRAGAVLHPTMIYGATGENNVRRLAALLRRLPAVPLPGGGRARVQPIHQSDVTRCIMAALQVEWTRPESMVIAGPAAVTYADFVRAVAAAAGLRAPFIVPVPPALLLLAAPVTRLPGLPRVGRAEVRRLLEDKAFDIGPMLARLGVSPIGLAEGLAATFTG